MHISPAIYSEWKLEEYAFSIVLKAKSMGKRPLEKSRCIKRVAINKMYILDIAVGITNRME